jgi:hypothetical protein
MNELDLVVVVANNVLGHIVNAGTIINTIDGKTTTTLPDADVAVNASLKYAEKFLLAIRNIKEESEKQAAIAAQTREPVELKEVTEVTGAPV